jgi:hypothetical protein
MVAGILYIVECLLGAALVILYRFVGAGRD